MNLNYNQRLLMPRLGIFFGSLLLCLPFTMAQDNSVVLIHADKSSGYGVAWGGPQNTSKDLIVTALHVVAGKSIIQVVWQGKVANAQIEKIYKPSDLALLRLKTPLGITPLKVYTGEPPWGDDINFWEVPAGSKVMSQKTTSVEEKSSLAKINLRIADNPAGLSKALCIDAGEYYPGMATEVINFKEPNIIKRHSGTPLTYEGMILGMVDGGANLVDAKGSVWAIPAADFNKLYNLGKPPSSALTSCDSPTKENKYMYSGFRSDNPMLTADEVIQAQLMEKPFAISANNGAALELYHNYTMSFKDVYETLFEEEKAFLSGIFKSGDSLTLENLLDMPISLYVEVKTGVSIVVPSQCTFTTTSDAFGTLNTTTSPGGLTTMSFYISPGETMDEGVKAMNAFKAFVSKDEQGIELVNNPLEDLKEGTKYYTDYIERKTSFKKGGTKSVYFADMTINDGDFLAVALNAPNIREILKSPEEKLFFYLMQTCTVLADYTIY